MLTASGEKITITTRLSADGTESVLLCVTGKAGRYIVDLSVPLNEEEATLLSAALNGALTALRSPT